MSRLRTSIASAVVLAVVAAAPALAAEPYWTSNGKVIPEGQSETVATSGTLMFTVTSTYPTRTITCKVTDTEVVKNPVGGGAGEDEMTAFSLAGCKAKALLPCTTTAITATVGIPPSWGTELSGPPIRDKIKGVTIGFKCSSNGKVIGNYEGELTPEVGASVLSFGAGSGQLEEPPSTGHTATVSGTDKLKGPTGDTKIGAEEVEHEPHWYSDGTRIPENTPETVKTSGTLAFTASLGGATSTLTCKVTDTEVVENPLGGGAGEDEMIAINYSACKLTPKCPAGDKLEVLVPSGSLPWPSELIAGTPIRDEISGIETEVKCAGSNPASVLYKGTLEPEVAATSALVFNAGSGSLSGNNSATATVSGSDKLTGPAGDTKITALDP